MGDPTRLNDFSELITNLDKVSDILDSEFYVDTCKQNIIEEYEDRLDSLNIHLIFDLVKEKFYCAEIMKAVSCIIKMILKSNSIDQKSVSPSIQQWITNITVLANGMEGVASSTGLKYVNDMLVVKTPRDPDDTSLVYELIIGQILNTLRNDTP